MAIFYHAKIQHLTDRGIDNAYLWGGQTNFYGDIIEKSKGLKKILLGKKKYLRFFFIQKLSIEEWKKTKKMNHPLMEIVAPDISHLISLDYYLSIAKNA